MENWCFVGPKSPYIPPETYQCLHGNVYNHADFPDGEEVTTSAIIDKRPGVVMTESGTYYELGTANPDYVEKYPQAKQWEKKDE